MAKVHQQELSALVVCKDERGMKWVKLLLNRFNQVYLIRSDSDCRLLSECDPEGIILPKKLLPKYFNTIFFHSSDEILWIDVGISADNIFEFNTPGNPIERKGILRILRCTAPYFDITLQDINDVADYSTGQKASLPSICCIKPSLEVLPALLILCQAYLATHSPETTEMTDWWLKALSLLDEGQISATRVQSLRAGVEKEWYFKENSQADLDAVQFLIENLLSGIGSTTTLLQSKIPSKVVVDAYSALVNKLNSSPDRLDVAPLVEEASIVLTLTHSPASTAVASVLSKFLKIEHKCLNYVDQQTKVQAYRESILVIPEHELTCLPKLRLSGFSGAVLVISNEPFHLLKQKYRVLRFGHGSHDAFEFPWHLSDLVAKAANLFPLEPENLKFLQNELKEYQRIYKFQVLPCLIRLNKHNGPIASDVIEEIANTVEQLRSTLPVACHAVVTIDNQLLPIQQHFRASIARIRSSKVLDQQAVRYLQQTFEQLYDLVICTGAS